MTCNTQHDRVQIELAGVEIDQAVLAAAQRFANDQALSLSDIIEGALLHFMVDGPEPMPVKFCATHRCVLEHNSSGTAVACPLNEGSPGIIPEDLFPNS